MILHHCKTIKKHFSYCVFPLWYFVYFLLAFYCKIKITMTGEPMHTATKERNGTAHLSYQSIII